MAVQPIQQRPAAAPKVNYAATMAYSAPAKTAPSQVSVFSPKSSSAASVACSNSCSVFSSSSSTTIG